MGCRRLSEVGAGLFVVLILAAQPAPVDAATLAQPRYSGSRSQLVVALTFDDGNDAAQVRLIFNTLRAAHLPATFFPYAQAMTLDAALWRTVAAAGYPIGNHTVSHRDLVGLSASVLRSEIAGATTMIRSISGRAPIPVLRPPYGAWDTSVAAAAAAAGDPTLLLWDVDPRDWSGIAATTIAARVLAQVRNGSVILLHAGPYHTAAALPAILVGLARRGFRFLTVPQLLAGDVRAAVAVSRTELARLAAASSPPAASSSPTPPVAVAPPAARANFAMPHGAEIASVTARGADGTPPSLIGLARAAGQATSPVGAPHASEQRVLFEGVANAPLTVLTGATILLTLVAARVRDRKGRLPASAAHHRRPG